MGHLNKLAIACKILFGTDERNNKLNGDRSAFTIPINYHLLRIIALIGWVLLKWLTLLIDLSYRFYMDFLYRKCLE